MAIEKCVECGGQVSTTARECPHCGAVTSVPPRTAPAVMAVAFCVLVIAGYAFMSNGGYDGAELAGEHKVSPDAQLTGDELKAAAKLLVTEQLRDPESARFGEMVFREAGYVCGLVNAKNSMGGYAGDKGFVLDVGKKRLLMEGGEGFRDKWDRYCTR